MANYYNKDLYKTLNVNFEASLDEIKASYRKLVRIYHPDVSQDIENVQKFKDIQEAYEVLSDEEKRKKYDVLRGFYREKIKKEYEEKPKESKNKYDDFLKQTKNNSQVKDEPFTQTINEALDSLFYGKKLNQKTTRPAPEINGDDINLDVKISCFEAINGTNKKVNILHTEPCTNCNGHKFINGSICPKCNGLGELSVQKKINVQIPKGVKTGSKVRVPNEGNQGYNGGKNGDLYLNIIVNKNPYYEFDGLNILCTLPITPFEAALGTEISIPAIDGKIRVSIPAGTSSGQKLKIASQGLENKNKTKRGDIIITVQIKIPENITEEEKELYKQLKNISKSNIRRDFNNAK